MISTLDAYDTTLVHLERLSRSLTWCCVILLAVLSLTPGDYMVRTSAPGDLEHFVAYVGTSVIACLGYARRMGYVVPAVLLCGYAGVLEVGQNWAPGRHPDFLDFGSSSAGAIAGMLLVWAWNATVCHRREWQCKHPGLCATPSRRRTLRLFTYLFAAQSRQVDEQLRPAEALLRGPNGSACGRCF